MKALVYTGTGLSEIRDVPEPELGEGLTIVDLAYCGICGSDMHAWHGHDPRRVPPLVLGHEASGVVTTGVLKGKRVTINPLMTCGICEFCTGGREHLCPERELIGMRVPGAFAEQVAIKESNLVELPDGLSFKRAALAEPLAVAVHSVRLGLAALAPQTPVTVLGGGAIGLLVAMILRAKGIEHIRIAETGEPRRALLRELGGFDVYDPINDPASPSTSDMIFDAVGSGITRKVSSELVRPGGIIVHIGLQDDGPGFDTRRATLQEITFIGTYCYTRADFQEAVNLLAAGTVTEEGWSDIRALDEGAQSFIDIDEGRAPPKIILEIG